MRNRLRERYLIAIFEGIDLQSLPMRGKYYRVKQRIQIETQQGSFTVITSDLLDVSDVNYIRIIRGMSATTIPWDAVIDVQLSQREGLSAFSGGYRRLRWRAGSFS
jgi:hypothetical protein